MATGGRGGAETWLILVGSGGSIIQLLFIPIGSFIMKSIGFGKESFYYRPKFNDSGYG
jgi:hypothetical protein